MVFKLGTIEDLLRPRTTPCIETDRKAKKASGHIALGNSKLAKETGEYDLHRAVYAKEHGPIPKGAYILHSCNNPACCNLDHLVAGTHRLNMEHKKLCGTAKGRAGKRKLTAEKVIEIRDKYQSTTAKKLAEEYNISEQMVWLVVSRRSWAHV